MAIEFAVGSAQLTPTGEQQLAKLADELTINNLLIQIHGHTDNSGSVDQNQALSEERALAVKTWLETRSASTFQGRITVFGHGSSQPVATNTTADGKRQNRRVEIVIGSADQ